MPDRARVPGHVEARRQLGLEQGTEWKFSFHATIQEDADGVTRETRAEGGYVETVRDVRQREKVTVVEILRENLAEDDRPGGWSIQRRSGPIYYLIGGKGSTRGDAPERYGNVRPGRSVYVQRGTLRLEKAAESWLAYVLPLRVGTLWHAHPEARDLASKEPTLKGVRTVVQRVGSMETKAGTFGECYEIATPGKRTQTTTWVCEGVGMVRRITKRARGNPRFVIEEKLLGFARK